MSHIFYHVDEGIEPHYDPITQDCRKIVKDGVDVWEITSYSIEERNDGSEFFQQFFGLAIERKIKLIEEIKKDRLWNLIDEDTKASLETFKTQLESLDKVYPPGFSIPITPNLHALRRFVEFDRFIGL